MSLLKDVATFKELVKVKMSGFATRPFLSFAMDIISFVEKIVNKIDDIDSRVKLLEQKDIGKPE